MTSRAAFIQKTNARTISREGSAVILIDRQSQPVQIEGAPLRALKVDDQHKVSRFRKTDGDEPEKMPILLHFPGALHAAGTVKEGTRLLCAGIPYRVDTLHPQMVADVCVELVAVAFKD